MLLSPGLGVWRPPPSAVGTSVVRRGRAEPWTRQERPSLLRRLPVAIPPPPSHAFPAFPCVRAEALRTSNATLARGVGYFCGRQVNFSRTWHVQSGSGDKEDGSGDLELTQRERSRWTSRSMGMLRLNGGGGVDCICTELCSLIRERR
eukprot:scaffold625_cov324-Pavlova_lutheri.AAC.143